MKKNGSWKYFFGENHGKLAHEHNLTPKNFPAPKLGTIPFNNSGYF